MTINCVWEHNGRDTLLYAVDFVGAYTRGETLEAAVRKMQAEICSYLKWCGKKAVTSMDIVIIEEKVSELAICDADSDVLFESEKAPLTAEEYIKLKALALKSAQDFLALYDGNIYECRKRGFESLESNPDFLQNTVRKGSYGEDWSLRKVLRRFIWHDRIHARAMYRMAIKVFGAESIVNPFYFFDEGVLT